MKSCHLQELEIIVLNKISQTQKDKYQPDTVACTCNPSMWEADAGRLGDPHLNKHETRDKYKSKIF
jgi:hypothetical protein